MKRRVYWFYAALLAAFALLAAASLCNLLDYYLPLGLLLCTLTLAGCFLSVERGAFAARYFLPVVVFSCIAAVSRAVFAFLPQVQPVTVLVLLCGVCFGVQRGFLCGALSALTSNLLLGQGPWTLWQMLAWGVVGLLGGLLGGTPLGRKKWAMATVSFFCGLLYSLLVDIGTVLLLGPDAGLAAGLAAWGAGLLFNLPHSGGNVVFLLLLYRPVAARCEHARLKYGL